MFVQRFKRGVRLRLATLATVTVLTGCGGGGGGGGSNPPEPVVLPTAVTLTMPATAQADASVNFTSSAATSAGLRYAWDFGDGGSSSQASPTHTYAQAGDFDVKLVVSNDAGQSIEQKTRLSVERTTNLAGLDCSAANARGWCWLQPKPNGNLRFNMSFLDAQMGWIAGDDGQIWKTVDAGGSWIQQSSDIHQSLRQVVFGSAQRGWALGTANGVYTLWSTDNGGQSWQSLGVAPTAGGSDTSYSPAWLSWLGGESLQVYSVFQPGMNRFELTQVSTDGGKSWGKVDNNSGKATPGGIRWRFEQSWSAGFGNFVTHGSVQRSVDGGIHWETRLPLPDPTVGSILLAGEDTVLIVSWHQEEAYPPPGPQPRHCHLSRDRGQTWQDCALTTESLGNVGGLSPSGVLWMTESNSLYRSDDFGASWHAVTAPSGVATLPARLEQGAYWMWQQSGSAAAHVSFDEGLTWTEVRYPESQATWVTLRQTGARQLLLQSANSGAIYVSNDGGQTWRNSLGPAQTWSPVLAFQALDSQRWLRLDRTSLQRTTDGGRSWQKAMDTAVPNAAQLSFISSTTGWLCRDGFYQRTRDGGQTWADLTRPGYRCNLVFAGEQHGWDFVFTDVISVRETKDGGATWNDVGVLPPDVGASVGVAFSDTELVVAGPPGAALSTDAGKTWRQTLKLASGGLRTLVRAGPRDLWATGTNNQVWHSTDGGATWARVNVPGPDNAIWGAAFFLDARRGWLDRGELWRTEDGGQTWAVQRTGSSMAASGLQFIDAKTGWLWGTHGLLMTGSGGQ